MRRGCPGTGRDSGGSELKNVSRTLFIPLFGKARVSRLGFFRLMFTGKAYGKIYRLIELTSC